MKNFWTYKIINPVMNEEKRKRNKRIKLILKAFGGKDGRRPVRKPRKWRRRRGRTLFLFMVKQIWLRGQNEFI